MIASGFPPQYLVDNWAIPFLVSPSIQSFTNWAGTLGPYDQTTINTVFGWLVNVFSVLPIGKAIFNDVIQYTFKVLKDQYDLNTVEAQIFDYVADTAGQPAVASPYPRGINGYSGGFGFTTIRSPMGPQILPSAITPGPLPKLNTAAEAAQAAYESGLFTSIVDYLAVGDEPQPPPDQIAQGQVYTGVIDLNALLKPDQLDSMKKFFLMLPRSFLQGWFNDQIVPNLAKDANQQPLYKDMFWGAFINLFNQANLAYIQTPGITNVETGLPYKPWEWEAKKLDLMMMANNQSDLATLQQQMTDYSTTSKLDPRNAQLLRDYRKLPRLGDMGLEITRQNAINELLKLGEYDTVQAILDSYNYAHATQAMSDALTSPIPFNIVDKSGKQVSKSTNLTT
jgi:hypothetical protein